VPLTALIEPADVCADASGTSTSKTIAKKLADTTMYAISFEMLKSYLY
jgi:hypothetical protein